MPTSESGVHALPAGQHFSAHGGNRGNRGNNNNQNRNNQANMVTELFNAIGKSNTELLTSIKESLTPDQAALFKNISVGLDPPGRGPGRGRPGGPPPRR